MRLSAREFESDYVYWYWTNLSTAPLSSPWVHDKSIRNHGGEGVNVLLVDGSIFWHGGAQWLHRTGRSLGDGVPLTTVNP